MGVAPAVVLQVDRLRSQRWEFGLRWSWRLGCNLRWSWGGACRLSWFRGVLGVCSSILSHSLLLYLLQSLEKRETRYIVSLKIWRSHGNTYKLLKSIDLLKCTFQHILTKPVVRFQLLKHTAFIMCNLTIIISIHPELKYLELFPQFSNFICLLGHEILQLV